ncbi:MAG: hypothetical protein HOE58_09035 [Porticoccaceae bacterium]|nr:hypothetical protein [Porticoccaceae bacterium]
MAIKAINTMTSIGRWFLWATALLIIGTLVLVLVGRQTISAVDGLRPSIVNFLNQSTGLQVNLGKLRGEWPRLLPVIEIENLDIMGANQMSAIVVRQVKAELDLFQTIRHGNTIWHELVADNLTIKLAEDKAGRWSLKDIPGGDNTNLRVLLEPLIYSRLIHLESVQLEFDFFSGKSIKVHGSSVKLENDRDFHRSEMTVYQSDQDTPSYLVLEGEGDPLDLKSFNAEGYLQLRNLSVPQPLIDLGKRLMPELLADASQFTADASGDLWFDIHQGGGVDFEGSVSVTEVPLDWVADVPAIRDITTEITGWYIPELDWGIRFQGLGFAWSDTEIQPLDLVFTQRLGSQWQDFDVSVSHLNLTLLSDLLKEAEVLNDQLLKTIDDLSPRGQLNVLTFGQKQAGYYASANLTNIDVSPYKGVPGIKGLSGYLEIKNNEGLFHLSDLDGFQVFFPTVYKDYIKVLEAQGTVYLGVNPQNQDLRVYSSVIKAEVEAGVTNIIFSVEQNRAVKGSKPEVNLIIGGRNLDATYKDQFLPYKMSENLSNWLRASILKADIKQFGMVHRSATLFNKPVRTNQLLIEMENGDINFHPQWLGLSDVNAAFLIDDTHVEGAVSSATMAGAKIEEVKVTYGIHPKGHSRANILFLDGSLKSDVSQAINIIAKSPLHKNIGPLADWEYSGQAKTHLALEIALAKAGGNASKGDYRVDSRLTDASLSITDTSIKLTDMVGDIHYSVEKGLYSDAISGQLWEQPFDAQIFKRGDDQQIALSTAVEPISLSQVVDFPWTEVVKGIIPLEGLLTINARGSVAKAKVAEVNESEVTLYLTSQLRGNEILLPAPLGKTTETSEDLALKLHFDSGLTRLEGTLGQKLVTDLRFSDQGLSRGLVSFDRTVSLPSANEVLIAAHLPTTEIDWWPPVIRLFDGRSSPDNASWSPLFDFTFDNLELASIELKDLAAMIKLSDSATNIEFSSHLADGFLSLPADEKLVPKMNLVRLELADDLLDEKIGKQDLDPRHFLAVDLSVENLFIGDKLWGSLAFQLRPDDLGAAFQHIKGNFFGLQPSMFDDQKSTEFFWGFDGATYSSRLTGPVGVNNIYDVFSGFDVAPIADSESGNFVFDLAWQDQPWNINKQNITGNFQIELNNGDFYRSPGGAGAALKLVSLFNFANWLKRLQLDFSDVIGQNLAYNNLQGTIYFDQGNAIFLDPLKMEMPSGRMSMAGTFNLIDETTEAQLVATLPVATNLPWVVALLGGIPAAAGVYITSKIVQKQVDRLSSISYELTGPWDDIDITVDEIFASELESQPSPETQSNDQ